MGLLFGRTRHQPALKQKATSQWAETALAGDAGYSPHHLALDGVVEGSNAQRVIQAFTRCPPNPLEARALRAVVDQPGSTEQALSQACGWVAPGWRAHMLVACHRRQSELWPDGLPSGVPFGFTLTCLTRYESTTRRFWIRDDLESFFADLTEPMAHQVPADMPVALRN